MFPNSLLILPSRFYPRRYASEELSLFENESKDIEYRFIENHFYVTSIEIKSTKNFCEGFFCANYKIVKMGDLYLGRHIILNKNLEILGALVILNDLYQNNYAKISHKGRNYFRPQAFTAFFSFDFVINYPKEWIKILLELQRNNIKVNIMSIEEIRKTIFRKRNNLNYLQDNSYHFDRVLR